MRIAVLLVFSCFAAPLLLAADSTESNAKTIASLAFKYLQRHQNEDGSYGDTKQPESLVLKTALVVHCLASSSWKYREHDGPFIQKAIAYLLKSQDAEGAFGTGERQTATTLLATQALAASSGEAAVAARRKAEDWLRAKGAPDPAKAKDPALTATDSAGGPFRVRLDAVVAAIAAAGPDSAAALQKLSAELKATQHAKDDTDDAYGSFRGEDPQALDADPVVATALAGRCADLIKDNYKKLQSAATSGEKKPSEAAQ